MEQKIKVRFKAYDDKLLDQTVSEIAHTVRRTGAEIVGPIP
ncbi:MAG: 30S ribosomal protein S10, partial [bacterium]